jgi:hypothetical protein
MARPMMMASTGAPINGTYRPAPVATRAMATAAITPGVKDRPSWLPGAAGRSRRRRRFWGDDWGDGRVGGAGGHLDFAEASPTAHRGLWSWLLAKLS